MCKSTATVNIDTEFRVEPGCPREGDLHCKVVRAECAIIDRCDRWLTFKLRLLLKLRVESCRCDDACTFLKEIVVKETIWVDGGWWAEGCEVKAAVCKCVLHRGKAHCNATALLQFCLRPEHHHACCCHRRLCSC